MITIDLIRKYRIGEFAIFDLTTAFLGVLILSPILSWLFRKMGWIIPIWSWLVWTLPIGILTHALIARRTPMTEDFLDPHGHLAFKIIIVSLVFLGISGVRRIRPAQ